MVATMVMLPVLLPETVVSLPAETTESCAAKSKRKRKVWKPSVVESMEAFVDVQKVKIFATYFSEKLRQIRS